MRLFVFMELAKLKKLCGKRVAGAAGHKSAAYFFKLFRTVTQITLASRGVAFDKPVMEIFPGEGIVGLFIPHLHYRIDKPALDAGFFFFYAKPVII